MPWALTFHTLAAVRNYAHESTTFSRRTAAGEAADENYVNRFFERIAPCLPWSFSG